MSSRVPFTHITAGSTASERLAAGQGTPEDKAWHEEQARLHQKWLRSKAGKEFKRRLKL